MRLILSKPYYNKKRVLLLCSEDVNLKEISFLPNALLEIFKTIAFEISEHVFELPSYAYNKHRKQYNSTLLLEYLSIIKPKGYGKYLGIVNVDLYANGLNFVFGEAVLNGEEAVISLHRLRPEFYGKAPDEKLFRSRILKEAVHELGHAFGLTHCKKPECVMHFSNSIIDTDFKSNFPCSSCQIKLFNMIKTGISKNTAYQ